MSSQAVINSIRRFEASQKKPDYWKCKVCDKEFVKGEKSEFFKHLRRCKEDLMPEKPRPEQLSLLGDRHE